MATALANLATDDDGLSGAYRAEARELHDVFDTSYDVVLVVPHSTRPSQRWALRSPLPKLLTLVHVQSDLSRLCLARVQPLRAASQPGACWLLVEERAQHVHPPRASLPPHDLLQLALARRVATAQLLQLRGARGR